MGFKQDYPDFASIERHVRAARAERAVALGVALSDALVAVSGALRRLATPTRPRTQARPAAVKVLAEPLPKY